jgi:2-desacetyl-2-hydroxyethyl bacteriochlorophyllide A dehydrogenase
VRVAAYEGPRRVVVHEVPDPDLGQHDVLLQVEACGVCGSDVASLLHGHHVAPGQVMGHEMSARVAALGPRVVGLEPGQRVAVRPMRTCGTCPYCRSGRSHLCGDSARRSLGYGAAGGYAEQVVVTDASVGADVIAVRSTLPAEEVLWAEPLAVAVHAVGMARAGRDTSLLVMGAGSVGLCVVAAARAAGVARVVVVEPRENRRRAAGSLGAEALAPPDLGGQPAFRAAVDTSGSPAAVSRAADALEPGGRLVLVGLGDEPVPWPVGPVDVVGSFAYTDDDFRTAVAYLDGGAVSLARFVTHRFGLSSTGEAIAACADDPSVVKAAVLPQLKEGSQ